MKTFPLLLLLFLAMLLTACEDQQPIANQPPPAPGFKPGETPPYQPEQPKAPVR